MCVGFDSNFFSNVKQNFDFCKLTKMPHHLTDIQKAWAIAQLQNNRSLGVVADELGVSRSCIYYVNKRWQEQERLTRPVRQGIGRISTEEEDIALVNNIRQHPFNTAVKAREETRFPGSTRTAQRRLKEAGLKNCVAARKVFLSEEHKRRRVQFANEFVNL